ncbi:MAG: VWA domain-containing protein [Acidobacteria bacterium]|nr:VWA domain-containing protein [Acidobacteriota bacterium]
MFSFSISRLGIQFAEPQNVYLVIGAFVLLCLILWKKKRTYFAHSLAHHPLILQMKPSYLRFVPRILLTIGFLAAGITLLDPRVTFREGVTRYEGLDIVLAVDLSSSMQEVMGAQEMRKVYEAKLRTGDNKGKAPTWETRMQALQRALLDLIPKRKNDRIGLIAFSENAYVVSPLTLDHGYLEKYVQMVDPEILIGEGMTAIGEGVTAAMKLFQWRQEQENNLDNRNKVIVVFTDGENNFGRDPLEALSEARFRGYRVYLIGVDLPPEVTRKESQKLLIHAVLNTGGKYYDARDKNQLAEANNAIDRTEKGIFVERTVETDVPIYQVFVFASLGFLAVGLVLSSIPYFVEIS